MESLGPGHRPSRFGPSRRVKKRRNKSNVKELERRFREGKDFVTGETLQGEAAVEWRELRYERASSTREDIIVSVRRETKDGIRICDPPEPEAPERIG